MCNGKWIFRNYWTNRNNLTEFQVGDKVYGRTPLNKIGAFAEYIAIDKEAIAIIPNYISLKEAACIPLTAGNLYEKSMLYPFQNKKYTYVLYVSISRI